MVAAFGRNGKWFLELACCAVNGKDMGYLPHQPEVVSREFVVYAGRKLMLRCSSQPRLAWLACLPVYLASFEVSLAATTNLWTNSVSDLWRTGLNWSSNVPPDATFTYILITNAGAITVTI